MQPMHLLFICTYNRWRSLTAEKLFANRAGITAKSAGIASTARIRVTPKLLEWADLIFVMEQRHADYLRENFLTLLTEKKLVCLHISSGYRFNDPDLIELLSESVEGYLP